MAFLLNLLGTDTLFSPGEIDQGIPVSETLSFISTCVDPATKLAGVGEAFVSLPDVPAPYLRPGVIVIEGPVTSGTDVYDKMARGVYALLSAIQDGEHQLNLIGHSRGAVECIVVAHELQRIQDVLKARAEMPTKAELIDIFCDSPCPKTKGHLETLLHPLKEREDITLDRVANGFKREGESALQINLFALDPVPGVEHETYAGALGWAWKDVRHYKIPPIVKDYRQIILENETSIGFRGIVPKVVDPKVTKYKLLNMLGHHGTASGNPLDQRHTPGSKKDADKTRDCQIVTMAQLYDFLSTKGIQFKQDTSGFFLMPYFNKYHMSNFREKRDFKLAHYAQMRKFREFYEAFNKTFYASGQEDMGSRVWKKVDDDRKLYYHDCLDTVTRLGSIIPFKREGVINEEEAMLCVGLSLDLQDETEYPEDYLVSFTDVFCGIDGDTAATRLKADNAIKIVTGNIHNGVISIVTSLIETYLRNDLTAERERAIVGALNQVKLLCSSDGVEQDQLAQFKNDLYKRLLEEVNQGIDAQVKSQFADLSDLVFALDDPFREERSEFDEYQIAFNKHEQFLNFSKSLARVVACFAYPDVKTQHEFEKQVQRLLYYAEGVELYCAKAMMKTGKPIPRPRSAEEASFAEKVGRFMQGLDGRLAVENQQLSAIIREKDVGMFALSIEMQRIQEALDKAIDQLSIRDMRLQEASNESEKQRLVIRQNAERSDALKLQFEATIARLQSSVSQHTNTENEQRALLERTTQLYTDLTEETVHLRRVVSATNLQCSAAENAFSGISLQVLGGFAAVIGIAAVAVSVVVLLLLGNGWLVPVVASIGVGVAMAAVGLFTYREGAQRQVKEAVAATLLIPRAV